MALVASSSARSLGQRVASNGAANSRTLCFQFFRDSRGGRSWRHGRPGPSQPSLTSPTRRSKSKNVMWISNKRATGSHFFMFRRPLIHLIGFVTALFGSETLPKTLMTKTATSSSHCGSSSTDLATAQESRLIALLFLCDG